MNLSALALKLASAYVVRKAQSIVAPGQNNAPLQIGNEWFLTDAAVVLEYIAVEKDIVGYCASFDAGKQEPREPVMRLEPNRARCSGLYAQRTIIEGEVSFRSSVNPVFA